MEVVFRAFDGKEFDDEFECEDYEWKLQRQDAMFQLVFRDGNGNILDNKLSEDTYSRVMHIEVKSQEAAHVLKDIADYTGFGSYEGIDETGNWWWDDTTNEFKKF